MKEITRDKVTINYKVAGNGETTLLLLHGSYIDQTYWEKQVAFLSPNYKVVTLDLPGHGLSGRERTEWSTNGFAKDVIAVIESLALKNVILIGHSWGADVLLAVATSIVEPIMGFVAVDYFKNATIPVAPQDQVDAINANLKKDFAGTNENYCRFALLTPDAPEEIASRAVNDFRNAYEPMGQAIMQETFEMYKTQRELLPNLRHKLYLINVDYQPTNEEPLKQYCHYGYDLRQIKGTSHFPMIEIPEKLNEQILEVVQEIEQSL